MIYENSSFQYNVVVAHLLRPGTLRWWWWWKPLNQDGWKLNFYPRLDVRYRGFAGRLHHLSILVVGSFCRHTVEYELERWENFSVENEDSGKN